MCVYLSVYVCVSVYHLYDKSNYIFRKYFFEVSQGLPLASPSFDVKLACFSQHYWGTVGREGKLL